MKRPASICIGILLVASLVLVGQGFGSDAGGDIIYTEPVVGVLFSHDTHVDDVGFDCETCHDGLFEYEALASQQQPDFNMKALYEGAYCGACHDGEMAFASDTKCTLCHIGVKGYNRALGVETAETHH